MAQFQFKKAQRKGIYARIAILGPTGGGKTYSALSIATGLVEGSGKRIAVIDTERSSADRYADVFDFDKLDLTMYSPDTYVEAIKAIDPEVYGAVVIDSLTHAWTGKDGALEQVDKAAVRSGGGNKFAGWRDVTPMHNRLVDAMLSIQAHLVVTMRSKMEYILEEDERGRKVPKKVGMAPIQRDGMEYELDIVGDMTTDNKMVISKSRASFLAGEVINKPGVELGRRILEWCGTVEPKPWEPTDEDIKDLVALAKTHDKTPDEVVSTAKALFDKHPRQLDKAEWDNLTKQIKGEA